MSYPQTSSQRLLLLLELLQTRQQWNGTVLSERLGVTTRTLRRDVERIRDMGYRIDATFGPLGGYRMTASNTLPPLLFNEDEAVAISLALIAASATSLVDAHATTQAMAKLQQLLPRHLKEHAEALNAGISPPTPDAATVSATTVGELSLACRDQLEVQFDYRKPTDTPQPRTVQPTALVPTRNTWYLLAWDVDRAGLRVFRLDRISTLTTTTKRFELRPLPNGTTPAQYVALALQTQRPTVTLDVTIDLPLEQWKAYAGEWAHNSTADTATQTRWTISAPNLQDAAVLLLWIPTDVTYTVIADDAVIARLKSLAASFSQSMTPGN